MVGEPMLDVGMVKWFGKTAKENRWRVAGWITHDDLVQEGYVAYTKCRNAYPELAFAKNPTDEQRRWFMALVQTTFLRMLDTMSVKYAQGRDDPMPLNSSTEERTLGLDALLPPQAEEGSLLSALVNAPAELKDVVDRLLQDGLDGGKYLSTRLRRQSDGRLAKGRRRRREATDQHWDRATGALDLPRRLKDYLAE